MNNRMTKFAAAAIIVVAVLAGLSLMSGTQSVALADVLENVMNITSFSYWMRTSGADTSDYTEFQILSSEGYGQRSDAYVPDEASGELKLFTSNYILLTEQIMISILPENKQYSRINLTDQVWEQAEKDGGKPSFFLREFIEHPYTELGRDTIDGMDVIGFESTDIASSDDAAGSVARLWIDPATELPVKIETETFAENGSLISKMTTYGFEWNIQLGETDFTPVIPDDYVDIDFGEVAFSGDEKSVINGLKFYARIFDGKYPESLAVKTLTLSSQVEATLKAGAADRLYSGYPQDKMVQELGQGCMNLEFTAVFYGILASENKAVAYYGDKVTADYPDAVLMRWREDDGRYKIIFGDLTTKVVTEDALAELEAMPLIQN